ncbi:MAG: F0F1 ATP synthase subunit delta [Candidatus Pacebacteria bacterium]|nr:F0F1 ATP synthase subunit delta [Candidatus Paceibacterota bacterium]
MKISAKQYAQALLEIIEGKDDKAAKQSVLDFCSLLKSNNQLAQTEKIIYYFRKLYNKRYNIIEAEVLTKKALSAKLLTEVEAYLKALDKDSQVEISHKSSDKIIGGIVVKYGDKILDNSLKTRLRQLKTSLLK